MDTLIFFLIVGIGLACLMPLLGMVNGRVEFIEFPVFFSLTTLGFIFPQLISEAFYGGLPEEALFKSYLMAFFCTTATFVGYFFFRPSPKPQEPNGNQKKLKTFLLYGTLSFLAPFLLVWQLPESVINTGGWTGTPVMYRFFFVGLGYTSVAAFLLFLKGDRSKQILVILAIGLFYYFTMIILRGRRTYTMELFFMIAGGFYFVKAKRLPKFLIFSAVLIFEIFSASIADYRTIMINEQNPSFEKFSEINWLENFEKTFRTPGRELRNYIMDVYAIDQEGSFDYGLIHWNAFISTFVPKQIIGEDAKSAYLAQMPDPDEAATKLGHARPSGQTRTGMLDAFSSFWYFGFVKFFALGIFFKYLYIKACQGMLKDQLIYIVLLTPGLHAITHHTSLILLAAIHLTLFTWFFRKMALIRTTPDITPHPSTGNL